MPYLFALTRLNRIVSGKGMKMELHDDYELIAKHCPRCESIVMAKVETESSGKKKYNGYICSRCDWSNPGNGK